MEDEEKWFFASNENSTMGVAVNTQLILKADSLRCGLWEMPIQNSVRGKDEGEKMSEWQTQAVFLEDH